MAEELILLNFCPSTYGTRVRIALREKDLSFEEKAEDLIRSKSPLLLEMNPVHKKIPVLIHNGKPVCESLIIVQYIDETWNDRVPLLPSHPYAKAQARFWGDFIDKNIHDSASKIIWCKSKEDAEEGKRKLVEILKLLEGVLGQKSYFGGDTFGYVDIALIPSYMWFHTYETYADFSVEAECPKLMEWAKRCSERESVSKSLGDPYMLYDLVVSYRKSLGLEC